ncbi:TRAP transporter large permease [uncultured Oscillibacter sp.]|uniref:TRAP transporter large permease n=1 Tax=uncultured Oscillibacter sp. TaxID=876091 RepID=UPI0025DBAD7E|nr:TRAP transporter large permease [uncultured Oscillibacter sp.]
MITIFIFVVFFLLVLIGVPVAIALALGAIIPQFLFADVTMAVVAQKFFSALDSYSLLAIPFFMIAGGLLEKGGVSKRLVNLANALIGWLPGGLAIVVFLSSAFFGAISGSAVATVAAIGSIMLPYMLEEGYPRAFSLATIASAGYLGIIVPPSIPMVLYGLSSGASIGNVFLGGFIPGFMLAAGMSIYAIIYGVIHKETLKSHSFSLRELGRAFVDGIWALIMPGIVLGGIYGGIFTPTEAAAVSCLYGLLAGTLIYRELDPKKIISILRSSVISTAMILFVVAAASCFAYVLTTQMIPVAVTNFIISTCDTRAQFLLLVTIFLFFVGMVMDTPPAILVLSPLLAPVAQQYGIDPVAFGVIMIINLGIGLVTPPVGMNLYVAASIQKDNAKIVINRHLWAYVICSMLILILLMVVPEIIMFLPNLAL